MNSRDTILKRIKENRPPSVDEQLQGFKGIGNLKGKFVESLNQVGGKLIIKKDVGVWDTWLSENFGKEKKVYSEVGDFPGNFSLVEDSLKKQLNAIDVAILNGEFGVAENGAVWVEKFRYRAIPFITQHLILVIYLNDIVSTLHEAYEKIMVKGLPSFGLFISGPSKTADIEQSLVYGAHGARTLTVIVV